MALRIGACAWAALVALQVAWYTWLAPPANGVVWFALILTLPPLLLPLFALRTNLRRALLWIGIIVLFYFCHGVVAAWVYPNARLPALVEVALSIVIILALGVDSKRLPR